MLTTLDTEEGKIKLKFNRGDDTGMYLVDVFLETEKEYKMKNRALLRNVNKLLKAKKISMGGVVDFFVYKKDSAGEWQYVTML